VLGLGWGSMRRVVVGVVMRVFFAGFLSGFELLRGWRYLPRDC